MNGEKVWWGSKVTVLAAVLTSALAVWAALKASKAAQEAEATIEAILFPYESE